MNTRLLEVVTPQYICHGCFTRKTFWEGKVTGEEKLFSSVNMKNCGHHNVRKHKEINDSDKYVILEISLKFECLENMKIQNENWKDQERG